MLLIMRTRVIPTWGDNYDHVQHAFSARQLIYLLAFHFMPHNFLAALQYKIV